jgi:hypothetical protein
MKAEHVKTDREIFEERVFNRYFLSTIQRTGKGGMFELQAVGAVPMAEFCARDGDSYVREDVSAMWFGWGLHAKHMESKNAK